MKRLLLITGDIAAGKSTFANILSERYRTSAYRKDDIKEVLGDTIGFANREENLRLSAATAALMRYIFTCGAVHGADFILEANFHRAEITALMEIAEKHDYRVMTIALRGDADVLYRRFLERCAGGKRHTVHMTAGLENFDEFERVMAASRSEDVPGDVLYVDANDFSYQCDERLLRRIDMFIGIAQ